MMMRQNASRYLCVLISLCLLAGCSFFTELRADFADRVFGREPPNPPAELEDIQPTQAVKLDWSIQTGKTGRYDYTPALEAGMVFMANAEGELTKIDASNGRQVWHVEVGEPISGGVGVGGGLVLVGTSHGHVMAYDFSGKQVWKSNVSSEVLSAPRYFDGMVIARSGDNHIFGIDAADGARKWVYERTTPALSLRSSAGVIVDGGAVYAGFPGGKMVAVRADNGKLLWESTVAQPRGVTEIERIADITSLPVIDGPIVYAVAYQGKVAAVDRRNGKVVWNRDVSSYTGMSIDGTRLLVSHTLGSVYSLDYSSGKTFWRQGALANRRLTAPLAVGGFVTVGDLEGYVHFLNNEDGLFAARIKIDSDAVMSLIPGNSSSQLIAATRDGGIYAVSVGQSLGKPAAAPQRSADEPAKHSDVPWPVPKSAPEAAPQASEPQPSVQEPIAPSVPVESPAPTAPEGTTPAPDAGSSERSILFKNDSLLSPDQPTEETGPGIRLPPAPEAN